MTLWISSDAIRNWNAEPIGKRGGQAKYSDLAIETAMTLRLLLHLPFRQAEGFMRAVFHLADLDLEVPDHTTLSRRTHDSRAIYDAARKRNAKVVVPPTKNASLRAQQPPERRRVIARIKEVGRER